MYPLIQSPDFYASVRNINHQMLIHGTHRISTRETTYDLVFCANGESDPFVIPMVIERIQIFADDETQERYYNGHRAAVNLNRPPSYTLRYYFANVQNEALENDVFKEFVGNNIGPTFNSTEFEFFGALRSGRWFFQESEATMFESDVLDLNSLGGLQFYFYNLQDIDVDLNSVIVGISSLNFPDKNIESVTGDPQFWFNTIYIVFRHGPTSSLSPGDKIQEIVTKYLLQNNFRVFGVEYLPPVDFKP